MKRLLYPVLLAIAAFICARAAETAPANPPAPPAPTAYTMDNCVTTFDPAKLEKNGGGQQFWFANRNFTPEHFTVKLSIMPPDKVSHPPHHHPEDEFFIIMEGKAEFMLNGEKRIVEPLTCCYAPSEMPHGIRNVGTTELKYIVLKKYPVK